MSHRFTQIKAAKTGPGLTPFSELSMELKSKWVKNAFNLISDCSVFGNQGKSVRIRDKHSMSRSRNGNC